MPRQSITLTNPNDKWLQDLANSGEYSSKSEIINDLIRRARREEKQIEDIRLALMAAEKRTEKEGYSSLTVAEIWEKAKSKLTNG